MSLRVWVKALLLASAAACRDPARVSDPELGAGVREALAAGGEVNVMVALATEAGASGQDSSSATAIARAQDALLSTLDAADFRLRLVRWDGIKRRYFRITPSESDG